MNLWNKISNIGANENTPAAELRRIHLINQSSLIATSLTFAFVPVMFFFEMRYYIPFQVATGLLCSVSFFICRRREFAAAIVLLVLALSTNLLYCNLCYHNTGVQYFFFPLAVIPLATIRNMKIVSFLIAWSVAAFFVTTYLSTIIPARGVISEPLITITYCVVIISAFASLLTTILNLKKANDKYEENIIQQKKFVEEQKQVVEEKQKEILDSIHYAKRIQTALLASEKYIERKLNELGK